MTPPTNTDVVVIGGGPAGSTAATLLAQKGFDVVLFDRERHPRYAVGESLIPHTWKYTDLTGATPKLQADGFIQKAGGTVVWNGTIRQMAFKDFGYTNPALHVERDRYDHILLEHGRSQGVQVFEEVAVQSVELRGEGHAVGVDYREAGEKPQGRITCRYVVDASGQAAVLAKQLGIRAVDEGFRFMSVWGYFEGSKYVGPGGVVHPFEDLRKSPPTTFVTSLDQVGDWGWSWHIPLRERTSVGLIVPQAHLASARGPEALERFFLETCYRTPYLRRLLEDARFVGGSLHVIRDYSYRTTQVAGPGYFLTGDAAAFVDPIFSVGVVVAMYSATSAAWAIDRSLRDESSAERNGALYSSQLLGRLEMARSLALPRYSTASAASDMARAAAAFESSLEQELMYVVSTVTTRNENVRDLIESGGGRRVTSSRYQELEGLTFESVPLRR